MQNESGEVKKKLNLNMHLGGARKGICSNCGYVGYPKTQNKGSGVLEIFLYLFVFSIPIALIYSIWRRAGLKPIYCRTCHQPTMIPGDSPKGQELVQKAVK